MRKRYTDTEIWNQDWFIALSRDYKIFWMFLKDDCDHAGIWRPNISVFLKTHKIRVDLKEAFSVLNKDRAVGEERVLILKNGRWFLPNYIPFQYGRILNLSNRVHSSVIKLLKVNNLSITLIRPCIEVIGDLNQKEDV